MFVELCAFVIVFLLVSLQTNRLGTHLLETESTPGPYCGRIMCKYLPYGFVKLKNESRTEIYAFLVILLLGMDMAIFRILLFSEIGNLPNMAIFMNI